MPVHVRETILDMSDAREMFDRLLLHWTQANGLTGSKPVVLGGGYSRQNFLNDAVAFEHLNEEIDTAIARRIEASDELTHYKLAMRDVVERLGHLVHGQFAGSTIERSYPSTPDHRASEEKFVGTIERAAAAWTTIDGLPPDQFAGPLVLPEGTTSRDFHAGLKHLKLAFRKRERAMEQEKTLRNDRRNHHKVLVARAVQYRRVIQGLFPEDAPIVRSMPYLWPKQDRRKKTVEKPEGNSDEKAVAA